MPKATKCRNHHIIILIVPTSQIVATTLRTERKMMYLEKMSLDLEEEQKLGMQLGR